MKTKLLFTLFIFSAFSFSIFSQGFVTNDGAWVTITPGTYVTASTYVNKTKDASHHGSIVLDGTLVITGDFINEVTDVTENVFKAGTGVLTDGTIIFAGIGDQHIINSTANAFINFENVTVDKVSNTVFLDAGSAATINGVLTVNAGGIFRLSSPSDGEGPSGSLITNTSAASNVVGGGNLYVDRHFETNGRYVYFSVPVTNGSDDDFDNTNNSSNFNPNLYTYGEGFIGNDPVNSDYSNWSNFYGAWYDNQIAEDGTNVTLNGSDALGYATYNEREIDVIFGENPSHLNNIFEYSPSVSYTDNDDGNGFGQYYDGWNFVGNPYPSALDWDDINWVKTNIANVIYMLDGSTGNYVYYGGGHSAVSGQTINSDADARYIPPMQGFFVKASAAPVLTIPDDARTHYQKDLYKNKENTEFDFEYIKFRTEHEGFSDETIVRFFEDATTSIDDAFDAYKMFPWSTPAMIYSISVEPIEIPVAINSLPISSIGTTIPLGFLTEEAGYFTISVTEFNFDAGTDVKLIDTELETEILLEEGTDYTFEFAGGESRERFYLFSGPQGSDIEDEPINNNIATGVNVWSSDNNVFISISSYDLINANIKVFDVLGRTVIDQKLTGAYNIVNVPGSSGTYFVKIRTKDGQVRTDKVFIRK